jgi:hypothetical protein
LVFVNRDTVDTLHHPLSRRDKLRITFVLGLFLIVLSLYGLLFTQKGNDAVAPIIQKSLSQKLHHPIIVRVFTLTPRTFSLSLSDHTTNTLSASGTYHLFPLALEAKYTTHIFPHQGMNTTPLPLTLTGKVSGNAPHLIVTGEAFLLEGNATYYATFHWNHLRDLTVTLNHLPYQPIMEALHHTHKSDTVLDGHLGISGIETRDFQIVGKLHATTHTFTPSPLDKDDNQSFTIWSLLADKGGRIHPFSLHGTLDATLDELGIVEQFVHYPLKTPAKAHLILQGTAHQLALTATAHVALGEAYGSLFFHRLKPTYAHLTLEHADAKALFSLASLPPPLQGNVTTTLTSDFHHTKLNVDLTHAQTNPSILRQHYHLTQPLIHFYSHLQLDFSPQGSHSRAVFQSDLVPIAFDNTALYEAIRGEMGKTVRR